MKTIIILHNSLGELITKGFTRIDDKDVAGEFEDMIAPLICYERSSDGCRFTLTEED